jgi:predicted  nucleic acid-binding Zn-ribbon protein
MSMGEIRKDAQLPRGCPSCGQPFRKYVSDSSVLDTILRVLSGAGKERGFVIVDRSGWYQAEDESDTNVRPQHEINYFEDIYY